MIPISKPSLNAEEKKAVEKVLASGFLAQGTHVAEFERAFSEYIGVKHAIATSSGTTALYIALLANGIGRGDEVITTPFTFIASMNAILYTGAIPVLVDIDHSFNMNVKHLEKVLTSRTRAIMPIHLYGQPADMESISDIIHDNNIALIEDACQAHGAKFKGHRVGSFGTGCFSFYATKNMTTGEGGMITTNDDKASDLARLLINHGMRVRYSHERLGYNFRMTEIAAAIGSEQLKKLDGFNGRRKEIAEYYNENLGQIPGLIVPSVSNNRTHVWHQYTLRVAQEFSHSRDELVKVLNSDGIGTGIYYPVAAHLQDAFRDFKWRKGMFPMAEQMAQEVLSIPVHPLVTNHERERITQVILGLT